MTDLPAPLTPPDCDVRALGSFDLDVDKLMASELVAVSNGDEFKAAVILWCRAWKQVPAASLPSDDRVLAGFAGLPLPKWKKVKPVALRGFVLCSDGRLYHPMLAGLAVKGNASWKSYVAKREADAKRLREWRANRTSSRDETKGETRFVAEVPVPVPVPVPKQQQAATARPLDDVERVMGLLEANPADLRWAETPRILRRWADAGYDFERTIWPVLNERVAAMKAGKRPLPRSLKYFEGAIVERHGAKPMPAAAGETLEPPEHEMEAIGRVNAHDNGVWLRSWGPRQGEPGCLIPDQVWAKARARRGEEAAA